MVGIKIVAFVIMLHQAGRPFFKTQLYTSYNKIFNTDPIEKTSLTNKQPNYPKYHYFCNYHFHLAPTL